MRVTHSLVFCIAAALIGGCASVPKSISAAPAGPAVREVRADPGRHMGEKVRWGGTISEVRNLEDRTVVTVVARPTTRRGEPLGEERSTGRFLAEVNRFLDPAEYEAGRRITVAGRIIGTRSLKIDQYVYDYPVVRVDSLYLWTDYVRRDYPYRYYPWPYYDPFWPDPFYHPFPGYPYRPWYYR